MKKVFIVECVWNYGDDAEHETIGTFADKQDAISAMVDSFERDKNNSLFDHCFDEEGRFIGGRAYDFTCREDHISIYDNRFCEFIEYNITEHEIK